MDLKRKNTFQSFKTFKPFKPAKSLSGAVCIEGITD